MTTIAVKDGIVAYDSRLTQGDCVVDDNYNKRVTKKGVQFFISGRAVDDKAVMEYYFIGSDVQDEVQGSPDACFIVVDGKNVYYGGISEECFWKMKTNPKTHYAIGSGSDYALGAMDAGATAAEAVKIARRDTHTGGKVRTYRIKDK